MTVNVKQDAYGGVSHTGLNELGGQFKPAIPFPIYGVPPSLR